jgi:hypothetical protein
MQHQLRTEIEIDAEPEIVWSILTDLERYGEWNPFIISSSGDVAVGATLTNRMQPPDGKAITFKPTVTVVEDGKTFEWLGHLVVRGLFDGRHRFEVEATPAGGSRVVHAEHFNGALVRFMRSSLDTKTLRGFELMNEALKSRAESRVEAGS